MTKLYKKSYISANCTIVCGVIIGEYAVQLQELLLPKIFLPMLLYAGNPAKFLYWVDKKLNKLSFDKNDISKCGKFRKEKDRLIEIF